MECEYDRRKKCDSLYIERYNKLLKENEELRKRNKELEEGFKATTEELCETAEENENLKEVIETIKRTNLLLIKQKAESEDNLYMLDERIDKAIEYIKERTEWNEYNSMFPSILDSSEVKKILNILKGSDKE